MTERPDGRDVEIQWNPDSLGIVLPVIDPLELAKLACWCFEEAAKVCEDHAKEFVGDKDSDIQARLSLRVDAIRIRKLKEMVR